MKVQIKFKPQIILALLVAVIIADTLSLSLLPHVDNIVNSDLYRYGLQFSQEWAVQYWTYSWAVMIRQILAVLLIGISMVSFLILAQTQRNAARYACYLLLIVAVLLTLSSAFFLIKIDDIINYDLHLYGLRFSYAWAADYLAYANFLFSLAGLAGTATLASMLLILFSQRKKVRITPAGLTFLALTTIGALSIALSIVYTSSILAFIGLGLVFWGIIFTYIKTEESVRIDLLDATVSPYMAILDEILRELEYEGNAIYLPPKYFREAEAHKAYIQRQKEVSLPSPEKIQKRDTKFMIDLIDNPPGILLTPPGAELARLFERTLGKSFVGEDLKYLQKTMQRLLTEDLEIVKSFEMETENDKIRIKIENSLSHSPFGVQNVISVQQSSIYLKAGSLLSSAIACELAKTTEKPIIIENQQIGENGRDVTIEYRILEEQE